MISVLQGIPAVWRQRMYAVFVTVGVVLGAIQVGVASLNNGGQPDWLTAALVVYAYLGTALGFTAAVNVTSASVPKPAPDNPPPGEGGAVSLIHVIVVAVAVLFLLVILSAVLR